MLISAGPRSTSRRRSSVEHANFFFEPVQFDFQPANLFVEGVVAGLHRRALPGTPIYKKLRQLLHRRLPPLRDLDGMHLELRAQLAQRLLTPDRFLKIAEDLNVLAAIDREVLSRAIVDLGHWRSRGLPIESISVNVSFRRLSDDDLVPSLRELNIEPGTVSFEFLESIFLDEFDDRVAWNIDAIKEMGIGIDVDDFGTGHTSFVSLLRLMPRRFKIDRQLIELVATSEGQKRLVSSIVDIGRTLGIKVVAEGVETMEQARVLREIGCDFLQGYAFARPMPAEDLERWLQGAITGASTTTSR